MSAPTVAVTCTANDQNGNPVAGARYRAKLDQTEIYLGFVVAEVIEGVADANGVCVLRLWPNALGVAGSLYQITATNPDTGKKFLNATVSVPNSTCNLHQILVQAPYPPVDALQQALIGAQAIQAYAGSSRYLGAFATDPTVRFDGTAIKLGDEYFSTASNLNKRWNGSTWQAGDISTANLAASAGSALVGFSASGAGATPRTLQQKSRDVVHVRDYGGAEDGVTDDALAFDRAAAALGLLGGAIHYSGRCRIATSFTLRDGCHIVGPKAFNAGNTGYANLLATAGAALLIDSTKTISLGQNSGISKSMILRVGLNFYEDSPAAFAGTAITGVGNDCFLDQNFIGGFNQAYISSGIERVRLTDNYGDCNNGFDIAISWDKTIVARNHFWPFITQKAGLPASAQRRPGIAFRYSGVSSYGSFSENFSFGYYRGTVLSEANDCKIIGCGADGDSGHAGSIGFLLDASSVGNLLVGCQASGQSDGYFFNSSNPARIANSMTGCNGWGNARCAVVNQGAVNVAGGHFYNSVTAIQAGLNTAAISVSGVAFSGITTAVGASTNNTNIFVSDDCIYTNVTTKRAVTALNTARNSSTAVIPAGSQSIVFNHGLLTTPVYYTGTPVNTDLAGRSFWIGNATATTLTMFISGSVMATNAAFIWEARIYA